MDKPEINKTLKLKDIVQGIALAYQYLLTKWKIILVFGIIGAGLGLAYAIMKKPVYKATLTFALEEKSSSMSSYANIASQFGLDLGGALGGSGGAFVGDNILELLKSRFLIEKTLLSETEISGKKELLITRFINFNEIYKSWEPKTGKNPVEYPLNVLRSKFTRQQDSLLYNINKSIVENDLLLRKVDKKLNIVVVEYESKDELFAKDFTQKLVKNASEFYIETKTKKSKANVIILERRVDSVRNELDKQMYGAAIDQDRNQHLAKAQGKVELLKQQMDVQILTTLYGELIKNLELTKFTLMREEPLVQVIDRPILPLEKKRAGKLKWLILGGLISGFISVSFLLLKRTYKKILYIESINS